ncbi:hypothetical protein WDV93_12880 [Pantoea ananatis]
MSFNQDVQTLEHGSLVQLIEIDSAILGLIPYFAFTPITLPTEG